MLRLLLLLVRVDDLREIDCQSRSGARQWRHTCGRLLDRQSSRFVQSRVTAKRPHARLRQIRRSAAHSSPKRPVLAALRHRKPCARATRVHATRRRRRAAIVVIIVQLGRHHRVNLAIQVGEVGERGGGGRRLGEAQVLQTAIAPNLLARGFAVVGANDRVAQRCDERLFHLILIADRNLTVNTNLKKK